MPRSGEIPGKDAWTCGFQEYCTRKGHGPAGTPADSVAIQRGDKPGETKDAKATIAGCLAAFDKAGEGKDERLKAVLEASAGHLSHTHKACKLAYARLGWVLEERAASENYGNAAVLRARSSLIVQEPLRDELMSHYFGIFESD